MENSTQSLFLIQHLPAQVDMPGHLYPELQKIQNIIVSPLTKDYDNLNFPSKKARAGSSEWFWMRGSRKTSRHIQRC
jgi:hypothetical protein